MPKITGLRKNWETLKPNTQRNWKYYAKLSALFFCIGGCFELLLIATGFYKHDYQTSADLERALERKKIKREFLQDLQSQASKKLEEKAKNN